MAARRASSAVPLLLLLVVGRGACRAQQGCSSREVHVVVTGFCNASGHPLIQARLEQGPECSRRLEVRQPDSSGGDAARSVVHVVVHGGEGAAEVLPSPARLQSSPPPGANAVTATATASPPPPAASHYDVDAPPAYSGYVKVADIGRYKVHPEREAWARASVACAREGATLAVPGSQREVDALWQLMQRAPPPPEQLQQPQPRSFMDMAVLALQRSAYLVGVARFPGHRDFTTIFGDELSDSGYNTWASQPSNEENCGAMFSNVGIKGISCNIRLPFICELPL